MPGPAPTSSAQRRRRTTSPAAMVLPADAALGDAEELACLGGAVRRGVGGVRYGVDGHAVECGLGAGPTCGRLAGEWGGGSGQVLPHPPVSKMPARSARRRMKSTRRERLNC